MIFKENKMVTVYKWDLATLIYLCSEQYQAEKGLGLPGGMTLDSVAQIKGKVAIRDLNLNQWVHVDDDRGRIFYDKFTGEAVSTTILGEVVDRRRYTKIPPPKIEENQLLRFIDTSQSWVIGFDWYELPIWDSQQNMSYYTGDFFVPNEQFTNIEPMPHENGFILDSAGKWTEPPEPKVIAE